MGLDLNNGIQIIPATRINWGSAVQRRLRRDVDAVGLRNAFDRAAQRSGHIAQIRTQPDISPTIKTACNAFIH